MQASISLLGNTTAHFSTERRKSLVKHLNKDLRLFGSSRYLSRGPYLFGDNFGTKAKQTADDIRALKGVQSHHPVTVAQEGRQDLMDQEILSLLCMGAISEVPLMAKKEGFFSTLFLVPKQEG